jgi:hypothetical protein
MPRPPKRPKRPKPLKRLAVTHDVLKVPRRDVRVDITEEDDGDGPLYDDQFSNLGSRTKARFDRFVAEYVFDYNATTAILRLGYAETGAAIRGSTWLRHPYVQWKLKQFINKLEHQTLCTRGQVVSWLVREANYAGVDGSAAARVSALKQLSKAFGLNIVKVEQEIKNVHVMEVPMVPTVEQWSGLAAQQQEELKRVS